MPMDADERKELRRRCVTRVNGFALATPAAELRRIADWYEALGLEHDVYGEGAVVQAFEGRIAAQLGKPAAVFFTSGVMAQLAAVRIWTEAARLDRFGVHPTAHQQLHEQQAHAALWRLHAVTLGDAWRPLVAGDLRASAQPLACVVVELPIRESGGLLPGWEELLALREEAAGRGIRLHMDGARLWESQAFYQRSHAEIAALFDSVYVSLYKGLGGLAGAMLAGDEAFVAQARLWRSRLGGTLARLGPYVASAALRFDERLAVMPALLQRARALAEGLDAIEGLRVNPAVPHTNLFHLHLDASADAVLHARDVVAQEIGCWLFDRAQPSGVPRASYVELYVGDTLLDLANEAVLPHFARLAEVMRGDHTP